MNIDIKFNSDYDLEFTANGDLVAIDTKFDADYQYLAILLNIDRGHNKQFPNLGIAAENAINGPEVTLFNNIRNNALATNLNIKRLEIRNNQLYIEL